MEIFMVVPSFIVLKTGMEIKRSIIMLTKAVQTSTKPAHYNPESKYNQAVFGLQI